MANLHAFSDEGRQQSAEGSELQPIGSIPRMKKCFGWMTLDSDIFNNVKFRFWPPVLQLGRIKRFMEPDKEYIAIVYEYIEDADNTRDLMQPLLDWFQLTGFSFTLMSSDLGGWRQSLLVDLSCIVHPGGFGWSQKYYQPDMVDELWSSEA